MRKQKKAFNFVELLLVMLILGVVIALTMPLLKNIKDDDKINNAYRKKAIQDVTDALALAMIKKTQLTGLDKMVAAGYTADALGLRNIFNTAIPATQCNVDGSGTTISKKCRIDDTSFTDDAAVKITSSTPGFTVGGKMIYMFIYNKVDAATDANGVVTPASYGYVFVDVNEKKSPNKICKDRYIFKLYNDRAAIIKDKINGKDNPDCKF